MLVMNCRANGQYVFVRSAALRDPRSLPAGTTSWERASNPIETHVTWDAKHAEGKWASGDLTVNVTEATGGAMPHPDFVTADYVRRFSIRWEASPQEDPAATVTIAFDAEQTAADLTTDLNGRYLCE